MANATSTELQELYIAYFGRAADPTGLDYWVEKGTTTSAFAASMHAQPEFKDVYGSLSTQAQVNQIYKNLFDRTADSAGLLYWTQEISLGNLELAEIAVHLIWAAKNNSGSESDKTALSNRTSAAIDYTAEVKSSAAAILAYGPENAGTEADADWVSGDNITEAVNYLSGIDATTTHTAAGITASVNTIIANGTQTDKKTFTLTTGLNTFTGGDSSDTFDASTALTLNNGDVLDGGGGTDTITAKFSATTTAVNSKNIEKFVITATGDTTLNFADSTGITSISNQGSTAALTLNSLNAIPTYELNTNAKVNTVQFANAALSGTADEFKVTLSGVTNATAGDGLETLTVTRTAGATNDLETLHLVSSTVANAIETVTTAAVDTTKLVISGDQNLVIEDSVGTEITTVDASAATGDVTVITGYTKATTVTGGSGSDTFTTSGGADTIVGGAGNDILDGGAGNDTIDGGAGNDTLTSSGTASLTGGAGNDTFKIAAASFTNASTYKGGDGTDKVEFSSEAAIVDADFGSTTSVEEVTFSATMKAALTLGTKAAAAGIVKVTNVATGEDTLTTVGVDFTNDLEIVVVDDGDDITASAFTKVLTVDVGGSTLATGNSIVGGTGTTDVVEFSGVTNAATTTDNITGFEKLVVRSDTTSSWLLHNNFGADGVSITIDGSAITSSDKVFTINAQDDEDAKLTIIGGAGNDVITISASDNGDSITGGAGNDTFKFYGGYYTSIDTISGGDGDDTLQSSTATAIVDADFTNTTSVKTLTHDTGTTALVATLDSLAAAAGIDTITTAGDGTSDIITIGAGFTTSALRVNLRDVDLSSNYDAADGSKVDASAYTGSLTINAKALTMATGTTLTGGTGTDTLLFTGTNSATATIDNVTKIENFKANSDANASIEVDQANAGVDESLHIDGSALVSSTSIFTVDATNDTDGKISITGGAGNDVITMSGGEETDHGDTINGGAGNDSFTFDTDDLTKTDTVNGGAGTDKLIVTGNADTIADIDFTGVSNVEVIENATGDAMTLTLDSIASAAGINKVSFTADATSSTVNITSGFTNNLTVDYAARNAGAQNVINASTSTSTAYSGVLSITAAGSELDSTAATITGGSGLSDTITITDGGTPVMTSVTNIEKVVLSTAGSDATVTLANGNATYTNGTSYETITIDGTALTTGVLTADAKAEVDGKVIILGGAAADSITVDESTNFGSSVSAGGGNDTIILSAASILDADDTISGGAGTDTLKVDTTATTLTDVMFTNITSVETLTGDADAEVTVTLGAKADAAGVATVNMVGTDANSVTVTSAFDNALTVDLNNSTIADNVDASASSAVLSVTAEAEDLSATDTVKGGTGSSDSITLTADDATATTTLMTGIETITVKYAANLGIGISMGDNDTQIAAGKTLTVDASALSETDEAFTFTGSASELDGFLSITGGTANDTITGAADNDTISGGSGADSITGGKGADSITGGAGADTFVYTAVNQSTTNSTDDITDWTTGTDKLNVTLDYSSISTAVDVNAVILTAAAGTSAAQDSLSGKRGEAIYDKTNEKLLINFNADNLITTQDYAIQVVEASTEANSVVAGDINNIITTTTGNDTIVSGDGADTITGGTGDDTITAGGGADSVDGGGGADTITGGGGADTIIGNDGNDSLVGSGGADSITGGAGADSITAGTGADTIVGGAGADVITLSADSAIDVVMFNTTQTLNGTDTITGFEDDATGDKISFNIGSDGATGIVAATSLRGTGDTFQIASGTAALNADVGLLVYSSDIAGATAADTAIQGMTGQVSGDVFFAIFSTDVSASTATNTVYRVDFSATATAALTSLGTFVGQLDAITIANSGTFTESA